MSDGKITRETFQGYDADSKLDTLFDYMTSACERLERLERKHLFDRGIAAVAGFVGGAIAVIGRTLFGGDG